MYEAHFQLRERPFTLSPRVEHYFPAEAIEQARQTLGRSIERAEGPALVVGPAGSGKSMLAQVLAAQFRGAYSVALLNNGRFRTSRDLLQAILFELGLPYRKLDEGEMRLAIVAYATRSERCQAGLLLLVDEAHTLSLRVLEELRLVTNVLRNGEPRVRLVLFGGPALEERFANPKLESFGQRLAARTYLRPWNHAETTQFILGQIDDAGGHGEKLFLPQAIDAVYRASDGIPRLVIQLCDHALALAFAGGKKNIGPAGIEEAWADLQQLPAPWNETARRQPAANEESDAAVIEFGGLDEELESPAVVRPALRALVPEERSLDDIDDDLDLIETRLVDLDVERPEAAPTAVERPAVRVEPLPPTHAEVFVEEEILYDHYGMLDARLARIKVRPQQADARQLADLIAQMCKTRPAPATSKAPAIEIEKPPARTESFYADDIALPAFESASNVAASDPVYPEMASISTLAAAFNRSRDQHPAAAAPIARREGASEPELLVIDDAVESLPAAEPAPTPRTAAAWRQDYRQLFTRLRRG